MAKGPSVRRGNVIQAKVTVFLTVICLLFFYSASLLGINIVPHRRDFVEALFGPVWEIGGLYRRQTSQLATGHMIKYCQVEGESKGALGSDAHLPSAFKSTRPHRALHRDTCSGTEVQSG